MYVDIENQLFDCVEKLKDLTFSHERMEEEVKRNLESIDDRITRLEDRLTRIETVSLR